MKITIREKEVLQLIAHEYSSKEIARMLYISDYTVTAHRQNMMEKLGVRNTAGLVRAGFECGVLELKQSPLSHTI
ncbi:UNVERIFIED_CONTAM: hypothetical protein GTU68_042205 [Idotea baltica]|nr:hypothetical protein [Idotea baltica]